MWPGPYTAGFRGEADMSQVPDVHDVLSHIGCLGKLWDTKRTDEQNKKLEFGPKAHDIFRRSKLPIPPELLVERDISMNLGSRSMDTMQTTDNTELVEATDQNER